MREHRDAGGTVQQSTGITAAAVARIEATAHQPRPRGRGRESRATAKARAELDIAIIRTMRDTLARVSEAASFTWQQIERRPDGSATLTFRRPKTDADTMAYLAPATVAALDAIRRGAADTAPLFGLSTAGIKRHVKTAGLEGVSSHGCRIGMAQDLARAKGIERPAIMQAGGWRSETTVARKELWSGPQGRICEAYLDRLTGGSHLARWALEYGDARLDDIPEELRSDEAKGERAKWLESRLSDGAKAMLRERSVRGLPVGLRSIGSWKADGPGREGEDRRAPVAEDSFPQAQAVIPTGSTRHSLSSSRKRGESGNPLQS